MLNTITRGRELPRLRGAAVSGLAIAATAGGLAGHSMLADPERAVAAPAAVEAAAGTSEERTHEELLRDLRRIHDRHGLGDGDAPSQAVAANPVAIWMAKAVGQTLLKFGLEMGWAGLSDVLGLGSPGPDLAGKLDELNASMTALRAEVEAIYDRINERFDEDVFLQTHRDARAAADVIRLHARSVANHEANGTTPNDKQRHDIASETMTALAVLDGLMTDGSTGAVPRLMTLRTGQSPVTDGIHLRDELYTYIDGFRAVQAIGLMNVAWVAEKDADYATDVVTAEQTVRETVERMYELAGARYPHPGPPGEAQGILHAAGQEWALVAPGRPHLTGMGSPTHLTSGDLIETRMKTIASDYRPVDGKSLQQYAGELGIPDLHPLPGSAGGEVKVVFVNPRMGLSVCAFSVWHDNGAFRGDSYERVRTTVFNKEGSCTNDSLKAEYDRALAEAPADVQAKAITYALPVETNSAGWAARVDAESIRGEREGIKGLRVERGDGDRVGIGFENDRDYDSLQVVAVGSGEVLAVVDPSRRDGGVGPVHVPGGGVELRLGYALGGDPARQDTRVTSVIMSNPGQSSITLDALEIEMTS